MLMPMLPQTLSAQTQSTPEAAGEASPATLKGSANPEALPAITVQAPNKPQTSRQSLKRNITAQSSHQRSVSNLSAGLETSLSGAPNAGSGPVGPPNMASQIKIAGEELNARPVTRPGEILEAVPGLIIPQHSGDGKANQYFLRGFNLDHGTDLAISVDDMPINMRTHAHGQGYADLNFLIPELIGSVNIRKGPYFADEGDFSSVGSVHVGLLDYVTKTMASITAGSFGYRRILGITSTKLGEGTLLIAGEANTYNGPWDNPDNLRKLNGVVRYSRGTAEDGFSLTGMAYANKWNSTDQIPSRAIASGEIGLYGAFDPSDGGNSNRFSLSGRWAQTDAGVA